jgi:Flp pilus assembly protein TadG
MLGLSCSLPSEDSRGANAQVADTNKETQRRLLSARDRRRSGNAILEGALCILPLFALILAFVDFGLMMYRWATLQNAVREGCRYAITFQTATGLGQDASIEQVVQQFSMGLVSTTDTPQHIFVNYYAPTNLTTPIPYASGGNVPGNVVEVSVQNVSWAWIAPLSGSFVGNTRSPINLNVYSSDVMNGYPAGETSVQR